MLLNSAASIGGNDRIDRGSSRSRIRDSTSQSTAPSVDGPPRRTGRGKKRADARVLAASESSRGTDGRAAKVAWREDSRAPRSPGRERADECATAARSDVDRVHSEPARDVASSGRIAHANSSDFRVGVSEVLFRAGGRMQRGGADVHDTRRTGVGLEPEVDPSACGCDQFAAADVDRHELWRDTCLSVRR
jgi:hypothetical protein